MVTVTITAWNKDGYSKDIARISERQVHMTEGRVKQTADGLAIDPADFPEMVRFTVKVVDKDGLTVY